MHCLLLASMENWVRTNRTRVLLDASERSVRRQGATSIFNSKSEQLELTISEE